MFSIAKSLKQVSSLITLNQTIVVSAARLTLFSGLALQLGCFASNPNEAKEIETKIEPKGSVGDSKIGLNDKKEVIMQRETSAEDELRVQQAVNLKIQDDLNRERFLLKACRMDMSDPRLGGEGRMPEIPEVDQLKDENEVREEFGLDADGQIKFVKREQFLERLKAERKYEKSLRQMLKLISSHREECEQKMVIARNKVGLPGKRFEAQGYYRDGVWVETRKAEHSIDDGLEISATERVKAKEEGTYGK